VFAAPIPNVHVMQQDRVNVSWGGFSVVQSTLNAIKYALREVHEFDWLINLSGTSYPMVSNQRIWKTLAEYPSNSNFMSISQWKGQVPQNMWYYYEECDNMLRRIARLAPLPGLRMHIGSQWFVATRAFASYVVSNETLVTQYTRYARHTMVPDESYFATILKHSPHCATHVNTNFLHVHFDQWETGNPAKCLSPNPSVCGRSPTPITLEYLPIAELSGKLFARKFAAGDAQVYAAVDALRGLADDADGPRFLEVTIRPRINLEFCLEIVEQSESPVRFTPCNDPDARRGQTLEIGPCSRDGDVHVADGEMPYSELGLFTRPVCPVRAANNQCLDLAGEAVGPGANFISYPCAAQWNQLFSFGGPGAEGHITLHVPLRNRQENSLCLQVAKGPEGMGPVAKAKVCNDKKQSQQLVVFFQRSDKHDGTRYHGHAVPSDCSNTTWCSHQALGSDMERANHEEL